MTWVPRWYSFGRAALNRTVSYEFRTENEIPMHRMWIHGHSINQLEKSHETPSSGVLSEIAVRSVQFRVGEFGRAAKAFARSQTWTDTKRGLKRWPTRRHIQTDWHTAEQSQQERRGELHLLLRHDDYTKELALFLRRYRLTVFCPSKALIPWLTTQL